MSASESQHNRSGIGFYLEHLIVIESKQAPRQRDGVDVHDIVLYHQPAIPIINRLLVPLALLLQHITKLLADLHNERNRSEKYIVTDLHNDRNSGHLAYICGIVLLLTMLQPRLPELMSVFTRNLAQMVKIFPVYTLVIPLPG